MLYLLFIIYFFAACFAITKNGLVKKSGISLKIIIGLFSIKVLVGIAAGLASHFIMHDQSDLYFYTTQGQIEYNNLIHHPKIFFTDSLPSAYNNLSNFFGSSNSFWNDVRNNILIKTIGIFNIFSRGNYYINSLFFNFICFFAQVALFNVFKNIYKTNHWLIIIGCFLLPSTLYFTAAISKDLIVFTALCFFCSSFYFSLYQSFTFKRICNLLLSFLLILLMRNFVAIILLPFAIAWFVSVQFIIKPKKVFAVVALSIIVFVLFIHFVWPQASPLKIVVNKQQSFLALGTANSQYANDTLLPTLSSFATAAPTAIRHAFLSPYPAEFNNIYLNGFAVEMLLYIFLLILYLIKKNNEPTNAFILFGIIFSFSVLLFIGYITTNAGTLVRYRSIYLPFLIIPILCGINWQFVFKLKSSGIKKAPN